MTPDPPGPEDPGFEPGYVPPDPDERPPVELWSAVGDIRPWGTALLLLSWGAVFAAIAFRREVGDSRALFRWGASAVGLSPPETAWRLLASTFVHAGVAHLFLNSASMLIFGPAVERILTRRGFWVVCATGGALASLASLAWRAGGHASGLSISVGASGAIFALGGALIAAAWRLRHRLAPGRARALGAAMLFLIAQGLSSGLTKDATDNAAHAGGIVAGAVVGALVPLSPRLGGPVAGPLMKVLGPIAVAALFASLALGVRGGLGGR